MRHNKETTEFIWQKKVEFFKHALEKGGLHLTLNTEEDRDKLYNTLQNFRQTVKRNKIKYFHEHALLKGLSMGKRNSTGIHIYPKQGLHSGEKLLLQACENLTEGI